MPGDHSILRIFLQRAHRRRLAWRTIEHAGIGLLIGCGVSLAMILALWFRGDDAVVSTASILLVSCIAGIAASARNLPSLLDTAMLAETHLKSPQLLSSALLVNSSDDFSKAVIAMAEARVRGLSPAMIITRRLGPRAWSAIGLSIAFVLVGATLTSTPGSFAARTTIATSVIEPWESRVASEQPKVQSPEPDSFANADTGADGQSPDSKPTASRGRDSMNGSSSAGNGGGSSRTESTPTATPRASATDAAPGDTPSPGDGHESQITNNQERITGGEVTATSSPRVAPWSATTWPADRAAAMQSVQSGAIPDSYRDLVRDYFERD